MLAGKKAGLSYHETIDDYNNSYKKYADGGEHVEDPYKKAAILNRAEKLATEEQRKQNAAKFKGTLKSIDYMPPEPYSKEDFQDATKYLVNVAGAFHPLANAASSLLDIKDGDYTGAALGAVPYAGQYLKTLAPGAKVMTKLFNWGVPFKTAEKINHAIRGTIKTGVGAGKLAGAKNDFYDPIIERDKRINKYQDGGEAKPSMQLPIKTYNPSESVNQQIVVDPYLTSKKLNNVNPLSPTKLQNDRSTIALNDIKKRRLNGDYTIPDNTPQNVRQYAEISPTGYSDLENYTRYVSGESRYDMDKPNTSLTDEEAWMKYNNIPHKNKNIIPSKFKPSQSTDNSIIYNKFNNETDSLIFNDIEQKLKNKPYGNIQVGEMEMYNGPSTKTGYNMYSPLGNFTIGKGKDEKGEYVSYYDKYDFDSAPKFIQDRLPGNEFEYYNRRYLKSEPTFKEKWDLKNKTNK